MAWNWYWQALWRTWLGVTYTLKYCKNVTFTTTCLDPMCMSRMLKVLMDSLILSKTVWEWNQLDETIPRISVFERELARLVRPSKTSYFGIHDIEGIRLLTRLRVQFSDLLKHKFRHKIQCSSPMCLCQTGIENNTSSCTAHITVTSQRPPWPYFGCCWHGHREPFLNRPLQFSTI